MKTAQLMKRDFGGSQITQRTSDRFFNATELLSIYNQTNGSTKELPDFWKNQSTQAFISELESDILNTGISPYLKTYETTRGRYNGGTWMHPYLFVKFAMWLSPKFELQIIKWVYDNLIDYRTQAGDFYKEMCKALQDYFIRNQEQFNSMSYQNEASALNILVFGTQKPDQRNEATEQQLALMNELQMLNIAMLERDVHKQQRRQVLAERAFQYKCLEDIKTRKQLKS